MIYYNQLKIKEKCKHERIMYAITEVLKNMVGRCVVKINGESITMGNYYCFYC